MRFLRQQLLSQIWFGNRYGSQCFSFENLIIQRLNFNEKYLKVKKYFDKVTVMNTYQKYALIIYCDQSAIARNKTYLLVKTFLMRAYAANRIGKNESFDQVSLKFCEDAICFEVVLFMIKTLLCVISPYLRSTLDFMVSHRYANEIQEFQ